MKTKKGFTLVELLVVISIIALLLAVLMPSLQRAKSQAMAVICGANLRTLSTGWFLYQMDNKNQLVGADPYRCGGYSWVLEPSAPYDLPKHYEAIKAGMLYKYCSNVKSYHCPADKRSLSKPENDFYSLGAPIGGYQSYKVPNGMNGVWPQRNFKIAKVYSDIKSPAQKFTFIEQNDNRGFNMGAWFMNVPSEGKYQWVDPIATWHHGGTVIGFADGHSEFYKWKDKRTVKFKGLWDGSSYQKNSKDWEYMSAAYDSTDSY
jgi:prepilin-type N-terminal cleavage/methylation domain-containing protein